LIRPLLIIINFITIFEIYFIFRLRKSEMICMHFVLVFVFRFFAGWFSAKTLITGQNSYSGNV
jgi:hypothetical protein